MMLSGWQAELVDSSRNEVPVSKSCRHRARLELFLPDGASSTLG